MGGKKSGYPPQRWGLFIPGGLWRGNVMEIANTDLKNNAELL